MSTMRKSFEYHFENIDTKITRWYRVTSWCWRIYDNLKPRYIWRRMVHLCQRIAWGFSDRDLWNMDITIAKFVCPRLKRYAKISHGMPPELTEEEWDTAMKRMIDAFESISDHRHDWDFNEEHWKEVQEGLNLFGRWFLYLWD